MKGLFIFFFISCSVLGAVSSRSVISPRSAALGSAIVGNIGLNETLYENPAAISFTKSYTVDGSFINNAMDRATIFNVSAVDSRTGNVAGGFAYSRINEKSKWTHNLFYLSLAERYWKNIGIGVGGRMVRSKMGDEKSSFYDFDLGLLFAASRFLAVGLTWKNMRGANQEFSPQEVTLGFQGAFSYFFLTFNMTKGREYGFTDMANLTYAMGLEVVVRKAFFFSLVYNTVNDREERAYAAGLGWNAPKIAFSYAYMRDASMAALYQHLVSMRLYF